jgi:hypothetical protein
VAGKQFAPGVFEHGRDRQVQQLGDVATIEYVFARQSRMGREMDVETVLMDLGRNGGMASGLDDLERPGTASEFTDSQSQPSEPPTFRCSDRAAGDAVPLGNKANIRTPNERRMA